MILLPSTTLHFAVRKQSVAAALNFLMCFKPPEQTSGNKHDFLGDLGAYPLFMEENSPLPGAGHPRDTDVGLAQADAWEEALSLLSEAPTHGDVRMSERR